VVVVDSVVELFYHQYSWTHSESLAETGEAKIAGNVDPWRACFAGVNDKAGT